MAKYIPLTTLVWSSLHSATAPHIRSTTFFVASYLATTYVAWLFLWTLEEELVLLIMKSPLQNALPIINAPSLLQYYRPFEAKGYQEAVRAMRTVGKRCIEKRKEAIENGEEKQRDILYQILQVACKCLIKYSYQCQIAISIF